MKPILFIGILLLACGVLALAYQGFSYVTHDSILDAGPVHVTAAREHFVWIPPLVGGAAVLLGAALLAVGLKKSSA
jgi:hypothetical protein